MMSWNVSQSAISCRAPRGARGLKSPFGGHRLAASGRAPRGARGLKFPPLLNVIPDALSRPSRGAWIEIRTFPYSRRHPLRRAPRGARGLKYGLIHW